VLSLLPPGSDKLDASGLVSTGLGPEDLTGKPALDTPGTFRWGYRPPLVDDVNGTAGI
jgi:hypothetical protein